MRMIAHTYIVNVHSNVLRCAVLLETDENQLYVVVFPQLVTSLKTRAWTLLLA